jgi:hypothetical protein
MDVMGVVMGRNGVCLMSKPGGVASPGVGANLPWARSEQDEGVVFGQWIRVTRVT